MLTLSVVFTLLIWDRDPSLSAHLYTRIGWLVVMVLTCSWPLAMISKHGFVTVELWMLHISERVRTSTTHSVFAHQSWQAYGLDILGQGLPWTPVALVGMYESVCHTIHRYNSTDRGFTVSDQTSVNYLAGDRLFWTWSVSPLVLVSLPSGRNAHYAIYAMIPWSVWSALGLSSVGSRLVTQGWSRRSLKQLAIATFIGLATAYALGFWLVGPWVSRRAGETAFYSAVTCQVPNVEPLTLLYDDWDRDPYPTPFGPIPHDLALRLYYLDRSACWHMNVTSLANHDKQQYVSQTSSWAHTSIVVISREHDLPLLRTLGQVAILDQVLDSRWDRTYLLTQVWFW